MRATSWIPVAFLALALTLAACSGSAVKEGSGSGADVVVPSDGEPSTGAFLRTRLASDEVPACFSTEVTCELVREDGTTVTLSNTTVSAEPAEGLVIDDHMITGDAAGTYVVTCSSETSGRVDPDPPTLTVVPAEPAVVRALLDPDTVVAGEPATVTCEVEDACGEVSNAGTVVMADEGVEIDGDTVTPLAAGQYDVWCSLSEATKFPAEEEHATLTALEPRKPPVRIELTANPDRSVYAIDDVVRVTGTAYDENGDVVDDAEIQIEVPEGMGVYNASSQRFEAEGVFVYVGTLVEDPSITDELELICDSGPPQLILWSPERGDTFDEPDALIPVTGQIIDGGGVEYLRINGVDIAFDEEGYFDTTWPSDYGLNVVWFEARDGYGNELRTSRGYYYSTDWIPMDPPDMETARRDDAMMLYLGQPILDDGDHDPAQVDDIATIIELLLSAVDIEGLIGGNNLPMSLVDTTFDNIIDYSFSVLGVDFGLRGDLSLQVQILDIIVGGWRVSALYRDGGIDLSLGIAGDQPEDPGIGIVLGITLAFNLELGAFLPGSGDFVGIDFQPPPAVLTTSGAYAHGIHFRMSVDADMPRGGDLTVEVTDLRIDVDELDLELLETIVIDLGTVNVPIVGPIDLPEFELTSLVQGIDDVIGDAVIDPLLNWLLDGLGDLVSPIITSAVTVLVEQLVDMLALNLDLPLPQLPGSAAAVTLHLSLQPSSVLMEPDGGSFGLGAGLTADKFVDRDPLGSILRDGCMGADPLDMSFETEPPMQVGFLYDFVNEAIFALWWGGGINLELDLGEMLGGGMGGISADAVIGLDFLLPPILTDCTEDGLSELQIGDLYLELDGDIMGFISGSLISWVDIRMQAEVVASGNTIGLQVSRDPEITLDIVEMGGALGMFEDLILNLLEDQLIPMIVDGINGALSSIPIPEIDLGALLPNAPAGAVLRIGNLSATTGQGYFTVGGDLQ